MFDLYDNDFEKAFDEAVDAIEKKEHRLIWADALIACKFKNDISYKAFENLVRRQPTIDAEPIVRCKDCKHLMTYNDGTYDCKYLVEKMFAEGELNNKPNDFCCWGERKEVEE